MAHQRKCAAGKEKTHHPSTAGFSCLAPRPGLEPGTYGLTGDRTIRPGGRIAAHFRPGTVQYFWRVAANLAIYRCGLQLCDHWILDSGAYPMTTMAATILNSPRSVKVSVDVTRAFLCMSEPAARQVDLVHADPRLGQARGRLWQPKALLIKANYIRILRTRMSPIKVVSETTTYQSLHAAPNAG